MIKINVLFLHVCTGNFECLLHNFFPPHFRKVLRVRNEVRLNNLKNKFKGSHSFRNDIHDAVK